jgi:hypothetical protein
MLFLVALILLFLARALAPGVWILAFVPELLTCLPGALALLGVFVLVMLVSLWQRGDERER